MPGISFTDFVDFVIKVGTPKMTKVREIKSRGNYDPRKDFWRTLREGIIKYHSNSANDKKQLDKIIQELKNKTKKRRYQEALIGYKKFLGRKQIDWFDPPRHDWVDEELTVRVNPELGLRFNNKSYVIKLYFKKDELSARKTKIILYLMENVLREKCKEGEIFAILDISNAKLFEIKDPLPDYMPLLIGEGKSFVGIWNNL